MFRSRMHKAAERIRAAKINSDELTEPILNAFTNLLLLGQATVC